VELKAKQKEGKSELEMEISWYDQPLEGVDPVDDLSISGHPEAAATAGEEAPGASDAASTPGMVFSEAAAPHEVETGQPGGPDVAAPEGIEPETAASPSTEAAAGGPECQVTAGEPEKKEKKDKDKKYEKLKKAMKDEYELIEEAAERDELPAAEVMDSFYANCQEMVTYPDKGDEYYDGFTAIANDLNQAVQNGDLGAFKHALSSMKNSKKACHDRYK
jgi:XXXCH domain-containing protein